jgi:Icc-related predicted phosphoesterase
VVKLLAFSDLHRSRPHAEALVARSAEADVVIGAGDFASVHEGLDEAIGWLRAIEPPTVLVPGNNETEDALRAASEGWEAAIVLHGGSARIEGQDFFGLGAGVPTTPWDWSFDLSEEEAAELLEDVPEQSVMVVHSPPYGHCDQSSSGDHLGSSAIAAAIERSSPRLAVCGHIHESWGARSELAGTPIANLGPEGVLLEL